ncbi:MAG: type I-E CRISPR-associated protein Cas5/CasD [Rubrimonas sp.]
MRWLVLRLRAPLAAFGAEAVDARGPTRDFPALSAITGLFANALGYERAEADRLQALQDRLILASRREAEPPLGRLTDFQTAQLGAGDEGWTTRGGAEGRAGGADTYRSPHIRRRDHHADARLLAVVTLTDPDAAPTLDDIAAALDRPARPLFIGRKHCLPSARVFNGFVTAPSALAALQALPWDRMDDDRETPRILRASWPEGDGGGDRVVETAEARVWRTGLHGGARATREGRIPPAAEPTP